MELYRSRILYAIKVKLESIQTRLQFGTLIVNFMVTTRKISKNYTQKEMRQESQWCTTKKLMSTKEGSNEENRGTKKV